MQAKRLLLESAPHFPGAELAQIHQMLIKSCQSKGIEQAAGSMDDETVMVEVAGKIGQVCAAQTSPTDGNGCRVNDAASLEAIS